MLVSGSASRAAQAAPSPSPEDRWPHCAAMTENIHVAMPPLLDPPDPEVRAEAIDLACEAQAMKSRKGCLAASAAMACAPTTSRASPIGDSEV